MARERIPPQIPLFNAYINSTADYLLSEKEGMKNWERLKIEPERLQQWLAFRDLWNELYAKYVDLSIRTRAIKDELKKTKKDFTAFAQPVLRYISGRETSTTDDYLAFHIKTGILQNKKRASIPGPHSTPVILSIDKNQSCRHVLRYKDSHLGSRAKPEGVMFCSILYFVGDSPPASYKDCKKQKNSAHSPVTITFLASEKGKKVWYFLQWVNTTAKLSPVSRAFEAVIA